jgi:Protein of unknown function (DUF664)
MSDQTEAQTEPQTETQTVTEDPWEPPMAGTEAEHLLGALDRQRWTFRYKADGLDAAGLATTVGASSLTLGGLLKHLALVEDVTVTEKLDGGPYGERWDLHGAGESEDWDFTTGDATPEELYDLYDRGVEQARAKVAAALASGGLDQPTAAHHPDGRPASLRRLVCDLVEEYGRHTGHADLLREAVDGRVGEDPPPGWRATRGRKTFRG